MNMVDQYLRIKDVVKLLSISKSSWWSGVSKGRYPSSIKISPRITVWKLSDICDLQKRLEQKEMLVDGYYNNTRKI
jgi:prophage regulatory protein